MTAPAGTTAADPVAVLDEIRQRLEAAGTEPWTPIAITYLSHDLEPENADEIGSFITAARSDIPRLLAALDAVLAVHRDEPLYMHSDDGECGCPVPNDHSPVADDVWYEQEHPEGLGPLGEGIICRKQVAGRYCPGCGEAANELQCYTVPKDYPPAKCPVRSVIVAALSGEETRS